MILRGLGLPECCSMVSRILVKWYCCLRSISGNTSELGKAKVRQSFSGKVVFVALHCKSLQKDSSWPQVVFYKQFASNNCVLLEEDKKFFLLVAQVIFSGQKDYEDVVI
jgi:hypothetical protein